MVEGFWTLMAIYGFSALVGCVMVTQWFFLALLCPTKAASSTSKSIAFFGLGMLVPIVNLMITLILLIVIVGGTVESINNSIERRRKDGVGNERRLKRIEADIAVLDAQLNADEAVKEKL